MKTLSLFAIALSFIFLGSEAQAANGKFSNKLERCLKASRKVGFKVSDFKQQTGGLGIKGLRRDLKSAREKGGSTGKKWVNSARFKLKNAMREFYRRNKGKIDQPSQCSGI